MKNIVSNLSKALKGELIKKKKSAIFLLAIIFGVFTPISYFIMSFIFDQNEKPGLPYNLYENVIRKIIDSFTNFMFIILIIINASKITQIDHKNNGWQLMDVLPIKRSSTFISKYLILILANLISIISFFFSTILFSFILSKTLPFPEGTTTFIPFGFILISSLKLLISSLFLTTLQYVFSVHFSNYIWAILIGFFSFLATNILKGFDIEYDWNPFTILSKTSLHISEIQLDTLFIYYEKLSVILSILVFTFGLIWFKFKTFKLAFLHSIQSKLVTLFCLLISIFGIYFYSNPNQFEPYKKTVVSGKIDAEIPIDFVYIFDKLVQDTIAIIPVKKNNFHYEFKEDVVLNEYILKFGSYSEKKRFIFSKNDSVFVDFKMTFKGNNIKGTGTRLAENNYKDSENSWSYSKYRIDNGVDLDKFEDIQKELYNEYESEIKKIKNFKTVNNYTYKNDFKNFIEKRITAEYFDYFEKLKEQTKSLFPNLVQKDLLSWKTLGSKINYSDEELLNDEMYMNIVARKLIKNDTLEEEANFKLIKNISKLKTSNFKEKLLYQKLISVLEESKSNTERASFYQFFKEVKTEKYNNFLNYKFKMLQKTGKGNLAFNINGFDANGVIHTLEELKGKFVVIDFWATWCGPCLQEVPYFEKMALKYKKDEVVFLSVSIDENKQKWLSKVKNNSSKVKHWIAINTNEMSENYQFSSIPKFVLIDKEGKFYESQMARPSEKSFETILNMALGKKNED